MVICVYDTERKKGNGRKKEKRWKLDKWCNTVGETKISFRIVERLTAGEDQVQGHLEESEGTQVHGTGWDASMVPEDEVASPLSLVFDKL